MTRKKVIIYASQSLTRSEKNYLAFKLEFLALKWSVTEKFSDYLMNTEFVNYIDNNSLTYKLTIVLSLLPLDKDGRQH